MELCALPIFSLALWFGARLLLRLIIGVASGAASTELLPWKPPVEAPEAKPARGKRKGKGE